VQDTKPPADPYSPSIKRELNFNGHETNDERSAVATKKKRVCDNALLERWGLARPQAFVNFNDDFD